MDEAVEPASVLSLDRVAEGRLQYRC